MTVGRPAFNTGGSTLPTPDIMALGPLDFAHPVHAIVTALVT